MVNNAPEEEQKAEKKFFTPYFTALLVFMFLFPLFVVVFDGLSTAASGGLAVSFALMTYFFLR